MRVSATSHPVFQDPDNPEKPEKPDPGGQASRFTRSSSKQAFMLQAPRPSPQLPVEVVREIARQYKTKHGIDIRFNGGEHNPVLDQERRDWLEARKALLSGPGGYVHLASAVFFSMGSEDRAAYLQEMSGLLLTVPFGEVLPEEEDEFNARIQASVHWKRIFDGAVEQAISELPEQAQQLGLSRQGTVRTLLHLMPQASRSPIGCLRTSRDQGVNGILEGHGHTSSYIVTHRCVICTQEEPMDAIFLGLAARSVKTALPQFSRLLLGPPTPVAAQADSASCGSLALSQQKELLKNDADQLRNDCLIISESDASPNAVPRPPDIFLPSPESMRYSQSGLYLKVARAVVAGSKTLNEVGHKGWTYQVKTLVGLLRDGAVLEKVDGRPVDLDDFRAHWLDKMDQIALPKRDAMQPGPEGNNRNQYLAHVVHRHARRFEWI